MSRSLSSQVTTGLRRALRREVGGSRASVGSPLGGKVRRPRRVATWTAAVAVVVTLSTQPAEAFAAAHAGNAGGPVTPQQLSQALDGLKHQVSAADTSTGGAGTGKGHQPGKGELPGAPGPKGLGAPHLSGGAPAAQTGTHTQPPSDLHDRQLAVAGKHPAAAKAAPDATGTTGIPGPATTGTEITSLRTATTSVFQNADGTRIMRVYSRPVHFHKSDGSWGDIDTRLVRDASGRWIAKANDLGTSFADSAADPALVTWAQDAGHQVSYSLQGAAAVAAKVNGNTVTYPGALPSTDVVYDALATSIKETLVLHDASAPTGFTFPLNTTGMTASLDKQGNVVFTDSTGKVDLAIPRGFMRDSAHHGDGQVSGGVTYQLVTSGGQQALKVSLDASWLHDPSRVFPVRVDPTTSSGSYTAPTSTYVETPYDTNFSSAQDLRVGTYDSGGHQATSYILFNGMGTSSLQNDYIEKATLNVDAIDGSQCTTPTEVDVRQIVGAWTPSTVTQASQVPLGSKIGNDTFTESNQGGCTSGTVWVPFDLGDNASADGTKMIENWVHGGANYGVALTADLSDTNAWKVFDSTSTSYPPYLSVTYSTYGADYSTPTSYIPPTSTGTGSQSVTITNRSTSTWATTTKLKARLYDANWNEISTSAPLTAIPNTVAPNASVTMTGTIPALAPGKSYQLCWDMYINGTDSLQTTYGVPYQNCTWISAANIPPQIDAMEPLSNTTVTSLAPEFFATGHDPDNWPGTGLTYDFQLLSSTGSVLATSNWQAARSWQVPAGTLAWNSSYAWNVAVYDGKDQSAWSSPAAFTTQIPQPAITSNLAQGSTGGRPFDPKVGNYTTAATDAGVKVTGPALAVQRSYNSLDPRTTGLFGSGWSSLYDMQVQPDGNSAGGVLVTNADGQVERFGRNDYALLNATAIGDNTNDGVTDMVAVDDSTGDLYLYPGPDYLATNRIGLSHAWKPNTTGANPSGNWSTLTNVTGGQVDGGGRGDLIGVDPTNGTLWEFTGQAPYAPTCSSSLDCSHVIGAFNPSGAFSSTPPVEIGTAGWNGMSSLAITPPLSGDGKKDLVAVETSTGILWAYPFNSDGTLGARVEVGTGGWNGMRELTGGTFQGLPGLLAIDDATGHLHLYPAKGTGTLGTGVWNTTQTLGPGWSAYKGLNAVNGIAGDSGSDFVATDTRAGTQWLYHSTGGFAGAGRTATGMVAYTSRQGQSQQLFHQADGTWILRDSTGTTYTFAQVAGSAWKLSSIKDKQGRTQTLTYNSSDGTLTTITDTASNRHLNLTWNAAKTHVATVSTDPVNKNDSTTALTWNYTYDATFTDELTKVCAPPTGTNTAQSCTGYSYTSGSGSGSHYRTTVLDAEPRSYWRLGDKVQSTQVTDEVLANEGAKNGTPVGVDLGESPGTAPDLAGSPTTVAGFNGTSSQISLPDDTVKTSYLSVGLWFKTTTKDGVLFSYQADDLSKGTTSSSYTPALYIGQSGKLNAQFYGTGASIAPMSTSTSVADGNWHYAVLTAAGNTQELWLDGQLAAGPLTAQVQPLTEPKTYVGAGYIGGYWPDELHYNANSNTGYVDRFTGQIAEVALYQHQLGAPAITGQYQAATHPATELTGITLPSGKSKLAVTYDDINDRASQITDSNGGNWTLHNPTATGSIQAYRSAVKGSNPSGYWTLSDWNGVQAANQEYAPRPTPNNGTYSNVTLGAAGALNGETSASFDGTYSWAELPAANVPQVGPGTISLYFKTTQPGVLFSYQSFPIGATHTSGTDHWNPGLYVGSDGKLHAELWNGSVDPIATSATVNDGKWHSVFLVATATNSQTLYLDGTAAGTLSGTISANGTSHVFVGAGTPDGWPSAPSDPDGHFNGQISNVAVFPYGLNTTEISNLTTAASSTGSVVSCHPGIGCTNIQQTMYDGAVLGDHPTGYWPFDDTSGNIATEQVSTNAAEQNRGSYSSYTHGTGTGPWASGTTVASTFDGTSSNVQLPGTIAPKWAPASVEVWFKTTAPGVIYSYQVPQLGTSGGNYDPALYVGTDHKLHGEFWNGSSANATASTQNVDDGTWHMAALVASGNSQQLYLDGQPTGTPLTGAVKYNGNSYAYLGAGHDVGWPSAPSDADGHFNGAIADFASYNYALASSVVLGDYQAATTASNGSGATADEAYRARIVQDGAADYWRLDDPANSVYAQDELGTSLPDPYSGTYTSTTLAVAGPSGTPDASAAGFDGSTSSLQLPDTAAPITGPASLELWFKTTTAGVLYSYQTNQIGTATTGSDDWNPALYVGADGKLHGQFWTGSTTNTATSTSVVTDGKWHQAVLTATGSTQHLYLDGASQAAINAGPVQFNGDAAVYIGAGTVTGWPSAPTADSNGTNHFNGTIAEVSYYPAALDAATVTGHYQAMGNAANPTPVITATVTDPGTNTYTYQYDTSGRETASTDPYKNTTSYTYDTGGFLHTVTDADGHTTTYGHDARGNAVSTTVCRTAGNCQTSYATYFLDTTNALDPQNDETLTTSDARSASSTDSTYQTAYQYDSSGNLLKTIRPDASYEANSYTAGTEAAVGGGTEPPGLLNTSTDFNQKQTSYYYTSSGNLDHIVSPSGLTSSYAYDNIGRISSQTVTCTDCSTGAQTTTTSYTWDGQGNLLTKTDPTITDPVNGTITHTRVTTNAYDADGDRTSQTISDATGNDKARTTTWAYTNTTNDLVTSTTDPAGHTTSYGYDGYGNLTSKTDPAGTHYSYGYSPMGQLQQTAITNYTGNPNNPVTAYRQIIDSRAYDPAGRLATDTDGMGRTTHTYYYDDNLVSEVDLDAFHDFNPQTKAFTGTTRNIVEQANTYDPVGNLTQRTTGGGKTTVTSAYDTDGRVTTSTLDPAGLNRTTSYTYDGDNHVLSTKVTGGGQTRETDNLYDALGDTTKTTVVNTPANSVTTGTYDQAGQLVSSVSPNGNATGATPANYTTTYSYDALGEPTQTIAPPVSTTTFSTTSGTATTGTASAITATGYNTFGETADSKDANGNITTDTYTIDTAGAHLSVASNSYTAPGSSTAVTPVTQTDYDALGRTLRTTVDPTGLNRVTGYKYDQLGNQVEADLPAVNGTTPAWAATYDLDGETLSTTGPTGATQQATYDDLGRKVTSTQIVRQLSHTTTGTAPAAYTGAFGYDDASNLTSIVTPNNETGTATYDAAGDRTSSTDALSHTNSYAYDLTGNLTKITEPGTDSTHPGASQVTTYDQAGNPTSNSVLDSTGATVSTASTAYDADGNPTSVSTTTDAGTTTTSTAAYNAADELTNQTQPTDATHNITTSYTYDAAGNATAYTDGANNTTYSTFNTLGLPESVVDPATSAYPNLADRTYTTGYDTVGEPITKLEPGNVTQTSTYDADGHLTGQTGSGAEAATTSRAFTYDALGRLTTESTPTGNQTYAYEDRGGLWSASGTNGNATYTYDSDGHATSRTDSAGTTGFGYDAAGHIATISDPLTNTTLNYGYYPNGDVKTVTYGSGGPTQNYSYNAQHQLLQSTVATSTGSTIASQAYSYYPSGRIKTTNTTGLTGPSNNTYTYDNAGRLTSWNNGTNTTSYGYDGNGNLTQRGSTTAHYNERNQLTSLGTTTYQYTARGTLSSTNFASTSSTTTSSYNAFDQLTAEGPQSYTYDAQGRLASTNGATFTYDDTTDTITSDGTQTYTHSADNALIGIAAGSNNALAYTDPHGDLLGTFTATGTAMTSSTSYDPWGQPTATNGTTNDLGYQGGWTDPKTGQINTASRWYDPATSDFTSRDTAPLNPATSASGNLYAYADDNPLTNADTSGNSPCTPGPGGGDAAAAAAAAEGGYYAAYGLSQLDRYEQMLQDEQWSTSLGATIGAYQGSGASSSTYGGGGTPGESGDAGGGGENLVQTPVTYSGESPSHFGKDGVVLMAGAGDCRLPGPPAPPPPPNWHDVRPRACGSSCHTGPEPGSLHGPEATPTHPAHVRQNPATNPVAFTTPGISPASDTSDQNNDPCSLSRSLRYDYLPMVNGRPVGVTAILCGRADLKPKNSRDGISDSVYVAGFPNNEKYKNGWLYNKTHILGDRFYGAAISENLFTGFNLMNTSGMKRCENKMAASLAANSTVYYSGTLNYDSPYSQYANSITMRAYTSTGVELFDTVIGNNNVRGRPC